MLLSMTGYGEARQTHGPLLVRAEVRSVNNRHLKVVVRCPDAALGLENEVERLVRQSVGRGAVTINLKVSRLAGDVRQSVDRELLQHYWRQVRQVADELHLPPPHDLSPMLSLPGVVAEFDKPLVDADDWPAMESTVREALAKMQEFRQVEGRAMRDEMEALLRSVSEMTAVVVERAPQVVVDYRQKLLQRVNELLRESDVAVSEENLLREVSLFADRCDITEELARLRSHFDQFLKLLDAQASSGRQLEFLCQELFRELNTIGSKANDVSIAHAMVEAKSAVEKIREIVQNVE